jgi:hypothetical protein
MTDITNPEGYNPNWDIDLKFGVEGEHALAGLFAAIDGDSAQVEVKTDRKAIATGNLYVECLQLPSGATEYKPSGVATSNASHWAFKVEFVTIIVPTKELLWAARHKAKRDGLVVGGKNGDNPTKGVLLKLSDILEAFNAGPFD